MVRETLGDDDMLSQLEEAELIGRSKAAISRARQHPDHPANGPFARPKKVNSRRYVLAAPTDDILDWWRHRSAPFGRRPATASCPAWIHPRRWAALDALAAGKPVVSKPMLATLHGMGLVDETGALTDTGARWLGWTPATVDWTGDRPPSGSRLSARQWATLRLVEAGMDAGQVETEMVLRTLQQRGLLGQDWELTDTARALLAAHADST